ncbi:MAG: DUF4272 domain-containing protein [Planctomycetes bacterium]|nr:DUF4272 domain-containing protein [Planctomycetota bacterium]
MACEPVNIFSRRIDVRGVIAVLRTVAQQVTVEGPEDDWHRLTVLGRKPWLRKPARLVIGHNPEYYDGPGWSTQMLGMSNYFAGFPDVPRKQDLLRLIGTFRFCLAFPECDLDIDGDDERVAWVHAICQHLDGVFFTPSSLRDSSGRILIGAGGEFDRDAVLPSIPEMADVPALAGLSSPMDGDEVDHDEAVEPPTAARVARRAMVLAAVANRGLIENEHDSIDDPDEVRTLMLQWIEATGIAEELEPEEWKALQRPVGTLDPQSAINAVWRLEGLGILLWSLGRFTLPPDDELVTPSDLFEAVALGDAETARSLIDTAEFRPTAEISDMATHLLMFHWRLTDFSLRPDEMDFVEFSKRSWIGEFDVTRFSIAQRDLALGGKPIAKADPDLVSRCHSSAQERHLAINWLAGDSRLYSETDTST